MSKVKELQSTNGQTKQKHKLPEALANRLSQLQQQTNARIEEITGNTGATPKIWYSDSGQQTICWRVSTAFRQT